MTQRKPTLVQQRSDDSSAGADKSVASAEPDDKDRLLCLSHDLTEERAAALARAVWQAATPHDFAQHSIATIHRHHGIASRGRAIALLVDCDPKTGERINKSETKHAKTWPLLLAGILPFLTLDGAVAYVCAATGMDEDEADVLLRRHLGPERGQA